MLRIILISVLVSLSMSQIQFYGKCPDYVLVYPMHNHAFSGKWYEYGRYYDEPCAGYKCITETFTEGEEEGKENTFHISKFLVSKMTNENMTVNGTGENVGNLGSFTLTGYDSRPANPTGDSTYKILSTDYNNFAILWDCYEEEKENNTMSYWSLFVHTRQPLPSQGLLNTIYSVLGQFGIISAPYMLQVTDQVNCPHMGYYPPHQHHGHSNLYHHHHDDDDDHDHHKGR